MRNRGFGRRISILLASMLLVGSLSVVAAPAAFAANPLPNYSCNNWGDIGWAFGANTKPWVIIDALWTTQAPGGSLSVGKTMSVEHTVTASVSATVATSAEAGIVFAKASASASLTLAASGSTTNSLSETTTVGVTNNTSTQKDYVIFEAVRKVTMTVYRYQCTRSLTWNFIASAPLTSYASVTESSIRCDIAYSAGTVQAAAKTFC